MDERNLSFLNTHKWVTGNVAGDIWSMLLAMMCIASVVVIVFPSVCSDDEVVAVRKVKTA